MAIEKIKIGATTLPVAGWLAEPHQPGASRARRLAAIRQLVEGYGLSAVELTLDFGAIYPTVFDQSYYQEIADLQQALGFACTVHLPFLWVDLASLNEPVRAASAGGVCRALELVGPVDVGTYVLHLWGMATMQIGAGFRQPALRQALTAALMAQAGRSLAQICESVPNGKLCVENLEDALFDEVLPLLRQHRVRICMDVGHLASLPLDPLQFWARHQNDIGEVHLHDAVYALPDNASRFQDHLALGQGEIDYTRLLSALQEGGFTGCVIIENNTLSDLEETLQQLVGWL